MLSTKSLSLLGGRVLRPDGELARADVHIADGRIVDAPAHDSEKLDCSGMTVLPGIVDVHGDAFERELAPRPGVFIDHRIALAALDRLLIANGITTAFHGLTVSWEPGARSLDAGRTFMTELARHGTSFRADHRVQIRWETFAHDAVSDLVEWLGLSPPPVIAFNDHTTATIRKIENGEHKKLSQWAERAGLTPDSYLSQVHSIMERAPEVPNKVAQVAAAARAKGIVMLSHDDRLIEERHGYRALGAAVCEFPLSMDVTRDAVGAGEPTVFGAPNVIRGGSHTGALSAEDAIREGLCTILASDYYYPSLFHAAERLVGHGILSIGDAWALISANPASAMGLDDRGAVRVGARADLVVADLSGAHWRLVSTIAGGRA